MNLQDYIKKFSNLRQTVKGFDFIIAFIFLLAYLLTSPYIYGWDDQHLEIPILKHLIDPTLYKGDYYVESASKYFTCWLYPILAKLITIKQIPAAYLVLFMISRYVMFYLIYRLWLFISGSCFTAICTTAMFFLLGRTDEFLYRSFCHEEFSFMFMFAGILLFYRERYLLAAFIFGLGVNFHAIYNLFPMLYMLVFLLFCHPKRFIIVFQTGIIFILSSLPFLCWQIPISISRELQHPVPVSEWLPLYIICCPQNFLFSDTPLNKIWGNIHVWWASFGPYLFLMGLYVFNIFFNPLLRRDKKAHAIMGLSWVLIGAVYYFDYVHPHRFVLDLNLVRVEQYMRFFMMGFTTIWACDQVCNSKPWLGLSAAVLVLACACASNSLIGLFFLGVVTIIFLVDGMIKPPVKIGKIVQGGLICLVLGVLIYLWARELYLSPQVQHVYWLRFSYVIAGLGVVFLALMFKPNNFWLRRLLIIVPLAGSFIICVSNSLEYMKLEKTGAGPWEMLRDWKDMQLYARDHTPKDALFLTPYDMPMGGFRIHSERKVLVCERDCGIIGFDYAAAVEWNKRMQDIKSFKIFTGDPVSQDVMRAILNHNVDYVVFMKYYGPDGDTPVLKKIYENVVFSLYQVV